MNRLPRGEFKVLAVVGIIITHLCLQAYGEEIRARNVKVITLRITDQVSGWREKPEGFSTFDPKRLFDLIDGGAPEYNDRGLVEGIHQRLAQGEKKEIELFAEDFGTSDNAHDMLLYKKTSFGETISFLGMDTSQAFAYRVINGYYVFAAIDRFYFEVLLTGISDKDTAFAEISRMFDYYKSRIQGFSGKNKSAK